MPIYIHRRENFQKRARKLLPETEKRKRNDDGRNNGEETHPVLRGISRMRAAAFDYSKQSVCFQRLLTRTSKLIPSAISGPFELPDSSIAQLNPESTCLSVPVSVCCVITL